MNFVPDTANLLSDYRNYVLNIPAAITIISGTGISFEYSNFFAPVEMDFVPGTGTGNFLSVFSKSLSILMMNLVHVTSNITRKHIAVKIPLVINFNFSNFSCVIIFLDKAFACKTLTLINFASGTDNLYYKPVACYNFTKDCLFSMEWETGVDGGQFLSGGQSRRRDEHTGPLSHRK